MLKHFLTHCVALGLSIVVLFNYVDLAHGKKPTTPITGQSEIFATVNGEPIYQSTVDFIINSQLSFASEYDEHQPSKASLIEGITKDLLISTLLSQEARKRGIDQEPESLIELELSKQNLLSQLLVKRIQSNMVVDEEKVRVSYESMPTPADYRLRIWTVQNEDEAKSIHQKLLQNHQLDRPLPDLVSQIPQRETIWWRSVDLDPALNHALLEVSAGEFVPKPVIDEEGKWRVVQVIEKNQYDKMPYEQEREIIIAEFKQYAVNELIERLASNVPITLHGKGRLSDDWYE